MLTDATIEKRIVDAELDGSRAQCTVAELVHRCYAQSPGEPALLRAALRDLEQSPAMLEEQARWIEIEDRLRKAGFSTREVVQVVLRGTDDAFEFNVSDSVVCGIVREARDADLATEVCAAALENSKLVGLAGGVLQVLASAGRLEERFDELVTLELEPGLREVLSALPKPRQRRILLRIVPEKFDLRFANVELEQLQRIRDLVATDVLKKRIAHLASGLRKSEEGNYYAELLARVRRGKPTPPPTLDEDGLSPAAREAFDYCARQFRETRAKEVMGELARAAHDRRVAVEAPELATVEAWSAASQERRSTIARAIAARSNGALSYVSIEVYTDLPIAIFEHEASGTRFSLVPGGSYERGLGAGEEALVREQTKKKGGKGKEAGSLLERMATMRPLAVVSVGPFLLSQNACLEGNASLMATFLEGEPFRFPSEAEWERAARGGKRGELTWRGHVIPDQKWLKNLSDEGRTPRNAFGLWEFGAHPELCADAWHASYEHAPTDGSPRWGAGPRVIRGGAAELSPWQGVGEWHLLCNAVRTSQADWETYAARPALGVVLM